MYYVAAPSYERAYIAMHYIFTAGNVLSALKNNTCYMII